MKRLILILSILLFGFSSCKMKEDIKVDGTLIRVAPFTYNGHEYLCFYYPMDAVINVIHSPDCHCRQEQIHVIKIDQTDIIDNNTN